MKRIFALALVLGLVCVPALADAPQADPQQDVQLIYPTTAIDVTELDSSTPSKRAEPPVRETTEFDPMTPIGQIRGINESLKRLEEDLAKIQEMKGLDEVNRILPFLEREAETSETISTNVESIIKTTGALGARIEELQKAAEDIRATVESVQKTMETINKLRESKWTDYAILAILAIFVLQLGGKTGGFVVGRINAMRRKLTELAEAYELAQKQLAEKETKTTQGIMK